MKIGFDVSQTGAGKAGCGYFADGMIQELAKLGSDQEYVLYPTFGDFYFDAAMPGTYPIDRAGFSYGPQQPTPDAAAKFWTAVDLEQQLGGVDIIHSNNYWCPRQLRTTRLVYTLYDLSFVQEPSWTTEANRIGCFYGVFGAAAAADWIIAISHASRDHFLKTFPTFPSDRVKVIFPASRFAASDVLAKRPIGLKGVESRKFWLSVGTIEPRKNHDRILQAFARYRATVSQPMPLVLAGGKGWLMDNFSARLAELGIADHVVLTGYVADTELAWLYENCYANIYVSLFEGFGLPVLEGMALGAPTIASNVTSIPEITEAAAVLIDPYDTGSLVDALLSISNDQKLRQTLSDKARVQAGHFQWEKSARQLSDLYRIAVSTPKRRPTSALT